MRQFCVATLHCLDFRALQCLRASAGSHVSAGAGSHLETFQAKALFLAPARLYVPKFAVVMAALVFLARRPVHRHACAPSALSPAPVRLYAYGGLPWFCGLVLWARSSFGMPVKSILIGVAQPATAARPQDARPAVLRSSIPTQSRNLRIASCSFLRSPIGAW